VVIHATKPVPSQDAHGLPAAIMPETFRFAKWDRQNQKETNIDIDMHEGTKILKSADFWMPLVFLAGDISLPIFINLISSYLYDITKGSLLHDRKTVHLEALYQDEGTKKTRKFSYSGDITGLDRILEKFNPSEFLDK
jgi:hypothetical protein